MDKTRNKTRRQPIACIFTLFLVFIAAGCTNPLQLMIPSSASQAEERPEPVAAEDEVADEPVSAVQRVVVSASEFSLAWDYPVQDAGTFTIYYRHVDSDRWQLLKTGLSAPLLSVDDSMLGYGDYEFAVSFTSENGVESGLHTSLDSTAIPTTGWYIAWERQA